ncbi:monooxygenase 2-like [Salvia miltiorrhiza]|uniref:monooxygenase 2-like n=1 Tax=Salvia miltiorrhiza TaxID=226208 RepID=UPI0025AB5DB4|nr:monooxygenase 2-like [Salvia miltiorrhiza]
MEDVVIVGAGIAGLATSLSLHRLGIRSLVLESADNIRTTGFALGIWPNGWRALDAIGVGEILRAKHTRITGVVTTSVDSGVITSEGTLATSDSNVDREARCVIRKEMLETLESELPRGVIRYSSKVVHIESQDGVNSIHLADGTLLKAKVLIGCDGVNSVVSKFLGFSKPSFTARCGIRGIVHFEEGHGFKPRIMQFFGKGIRFGVVPCDDHRVYWGSTFTPSSQEKEILEDPARLKQFMLSKLGKVPDEIKQVFEKSELENMVCAPLRFRRPWELLWGEIARDNVCVIGDALHPMTPDLGQGGCSALEESVVLAKLLAGAFKAGEGGDHEEECRRIREALGEFARGRRWRSFDLVATAYFVGVMQQSDGGVMRFVRDKLMAKFLAGLLLEKAKFDCGKLLVS